MRYKLRFARRLSPLPVGVLHPSVVVLIWWTLRSEIDDARLRCTQPAAPSLLLSHDVSKKRDGTKVLSSKRSQKILTSIVCRPPDTHGAPRAPSFFFLLRVLIPLAQP